MISGSSKKKGFTLIEILVAIAIVAILASVVLVSMTAYRTKARSAKALASLSSAIPSMVSCWGNPPLSVSAPDADGGECICKNGSSCVDGYGKWPAAAGDLSTYSYGGTITSSTNWSVSITSGSGDDNRRICCNSTMNNCKILDTASTTCNAGNPSY